MLTKEQFISLADKYETPSFLDKDPSKFMHRFLPENGGSVADAELVAFTAANLAFGRREQILSHVEMIVGFMKNDGLFPVEWVLSRAYERYFELSKKSFYRMYSFNDMRIFFDSVREFLEEEGSLGQYFKKKWEEGNVTGSAETAGINVNTGSAETAGDCAVTGSAVPRRKTYLHSVIAGAFKTPCSLISRSPDGCAKKINMFLRWMVRDNSPVDLGLWTWYDKKNLLMPLDTHVMQQSVELGFIKKTAQGGVPSANLRTALALTCKMNEYFPGDPVRGDFALFGFGVNRGQ